MMNKKVFAFKKRRWKKNNGNGLTKGIEGLFKKNKVIYTKGYGKITGSNTIEVTTNDNKKEVINAKNIIIATGSTTTSIPGIDIDEKDVVTSTGALSFDAVPESLLVVGAGVIGLELGSVWGRLGSKVTVVEFCDRILPGIDKDYANKFQKMLQKQGMEFKLNNGVKSVEKQSNKKLKVSIENKADKQISTMEFDKVLAFLSFFLLLLSSYRFYRFWRFYCFYRFYFTATTATGTGETATTKTKR